VRRFGQLTCQFRISIELSSLSLRIAGFPISISISIAAAVLVAAGAVAAIVGTIIQVERSMYSGYVQIGKPFLMVVCIVLADGISFVSD